MTEETTTKPRCTVINGDAIVSMRRIEDESVDVVLMDPPFSSGATREAAINVGGRAVLIERDALYASIARDRVEGAVK